MMSIDKSLESYVRGYYEKNLSKKEAETLISSKIDAYAKALSLFNQKQYADVEEFYLEYSEKSSLKYDPILGVLAARSWFNLSESDKHDELRREYFYASARTEYSSVCCHMLEKMYEIAAGIIKRSQKKMPLFQRTHYFFEQMGYLHQYSLSLFFKMSPENSMRERYWKAFSYDSFVDYSNVEPFLLEICPPHHIWEVFRIKDTLYKLKDSKLIEREITESDFKNYPELKNSKSLAETLYHSPHKIIEMLEKA